MSRRFHFFETKKDFEEIFKIIESVRQLKYVRAGLFKTPNPTIYESFLDYEDLGYRRYGEVTADDNMFLVFDRSAEIIQRPVPQVTGEVRYAIDQMMNPDSLHFCPSGFFAEKNLIAGKASTISDSQTSTELYNLFRKTIRKKSSKIGYAYVGEDALELMKQGIRMVTIGVGSPLEYDLKLPSIKDI